MTLDEVKHLKVSISKTVFFKELSKDLSDLDIKEFLEDYIPGNYDKGWEELTDEELINALKDRFYSNGEELEDLVSDNCSEFNVEIWK